MWGAERLWVSLDMCRFTPPWRPGAADPLPLHWEHDPHDPSLRLMQGVLALTDTPVGQGGFRCVPSLYRDRQAWPSRPVPKPWGDAWEPEVGEADVLEVPARAGDLIVFDSRLPHANSRNRSDRPRLAFYIQMFPEGDEAERNVRVDCWRSGMCHPAWRWRRGADEPEPWAPATLSRLGRLLLGVDRW